MSRIGNLARFLATHPLTRDRPLSAWARLASWQIRSRLQDEVIFTWIHGQRLAVRRGMTGATGNVYAGLHEFTDMMLVLHLLRQGDLFFDIGANIGSYTVLASGVRNATTWAFEPDPDTVRALKRNIELNKLDRCVVIHSIALGETDGEVPFTRGLDTVNRVARDDETNTRAVAIRRLDTLASTAAPLMIKMDVEGYEQSVVRGARGVLARDSLKVIALESLSAEIEALLAHHGFRRAYYDPFRRTLTAAPSGQPASNAAFVRDWSFVADRLANAVSVKVLGRSL